MSIQNLTSETDIIHFIYNSLNANQLALISDYFDKEIQRYEPEGFPTSGLYSGLDRVMEHFKVARDTWAEGGCYPQQIQFYGNKIVVSVRVHVRLKNTEQWIDAPVTDGFIFKKGKVCEMRTFVNSQQVEDWIEN